MHSTHHTQLRTLHGYTTALHKVPVNAQMAAFTSIKYVQNTTFQCDFR